VRTVDQTEIIPVPASAAGTPADPLWFAGRVPDYAVASAGPESDGVKETTVKYGSVVVNPRVFLPWLRKTLEAKGVKFVRIPTISSLGELHSHLGGTKPAVIVNASGGASATLTDVKDSEIITDRTHVVVVKSDFQDGFVRRGAGVYTYVFGRGDGTTVLGGVSEFLNVEENREAARADVRFLVAP
jgi:D-amino-acid oxidase